MDKGQIHSVTPCFRGAAFTSPQEGETEFHTHVNRIVSVGNKETELDMYSSKNPNTTTAAMQAVILDVEMPKDGKIIAEFNGKKFEHTLGELLKFTFTLHDRLVERGDPFQSCYAGKLFHFGTLHGR